MRVSDIENAYMISRFAIRAENCTLICSSGHEAMIARITAAGCSPTWTDTEQFGAGEMPSP